MVDGLGFQPCIDGHRHLLVYRHLHRTALHIYRSLFLHAGIRTPRILGSIGLHILTQPCHGRTVLSVSDDAGVAVCGPCGAIDIAPEGDAGTVIRLPHIRYLLLIALQLQLVVGGADVILRAVHRHLQCVLNLCHRILEVIEIQVGEVVRLTAVGINGSAIVAHRPHEVDELCALPLEGVVVIIDEDGVRPTLMSQFKSLDNPVVAGFSITAESLFVGCRLVTCHRLVHHVDEWEVGIACLHGVHPLYDSLVLLFW